MEKKLQNKNRLSSQELSGFCAQVAMMLSSGMPLYDGMEAMANTYRDSSQKELFAEISRQVTESGSLYQALKQQSSFPSYLVEMVGIGERTGHAEEVMNGLSDYYAREGRIRGAIRSAVTYPLMLGVMMAVIVLIMVWKVLPVFTHVLANMGVALSDSGNAMMRLGSVIGWTVLIVVAVLAVLILVCVLLTRTKHRGQVLAALYRVFPPLKRLQNQISSSRVASVLSMMLGGGFPLEEALEMVPSVLNDTVAVAEIENVRKKMAEGVSFGEALTDGNLFDELYNCMIRTGCEVGCVDQVMHRVAHDYEEKAEEDIANLVSIIEPTMVGVLSVVIGCVLLSIMLPMAGVISSIM